MILPKTFSLIFTFLIILNSSAKSNDLDEYIIEVIIFEQIEEIGNEKLQSEILDLDNIEAVILKNKPKISINAKQIYKSFQYKNEPLNLNQANADKELKKRDIDNVQSSRKTSKKLNLSHWYEKNESLNKLNTIYRRLDRRNEYKVLNKLSWSQPALDINNSPYVFEAMDKNGFLIKLYQGRYLHLDVIAYIGGNFKLKNNLKKINKIKLDALMLSIPNEIDDQEIKITSGISKNDGIYKIGKQLSELDNNLIINKDKVEYLLTEERRIFKNESHYFDHPKIGLIVSVYDSSL